MSDLSLTNLQEFPSFIVGLFMFKASNAILAESCFKLSLWRRVP